MQKTVMLYSWAMTKKKVNPEVSAAAAAMGRIGGARKVPKGLAQLTPEQRSAIARQGAAARWGKKKGKKKTEE